MDPENQWDQILVKIKDYVFYHEITSEKAWSLIRVAFLDAVGCAIESVTKSKDCHHLIGPVVPRSVTPDGFKLPGTSYQLDPVKGAFDLGLMIRYLDHNDALGGADWGHPSDNLAAILAVMDWLARGAQSGTRQAPNMPPLTMRTLYTAMIKAYEIQGCFLIKNAFHKKGLDHVILVKLASTAVVSWLLGLSEEQTLAALSHVWMDGAALRVYRSGSNTIPRKGWAAADASMRAVFLTLLVQSGQAGAPRALTMPGWGFYARSWDGQIFDLPRDFGTWAIENIFFKVIPVEGHSISAIEATLVQRHRLLELQRDPRQSIEQIRVRINAAAYFLINKTGLLRNPADRDHCLQYVLALTLLKGAIPQPEDYSDSSPWASSPDIHELRSKVEVIEDEDFSRDYQDPEKRSIASAVTLILADGLVLDEVVVEYAVGHVKHPKTLSEVYRKFQHNLSPCFTSMEIHHIRQLVEDDSQCVSDIVDLLSRPMYQPRL